MRQGFKVFTALVITSVASQVRADETAPTGVTLRQLSYAGSGCPADTLKGQFPVDGTQFLFVWDSFSAEAGTGLPLSASRRNCGVILDLDYPAGWQFTVASIQYDGHATVADGSTAVATDYYYFQGDEKTIRFGAGFDGPDDRDFNITDTVANQDQVWSTCDATRTLNLNFAVRVSSTVDGQGATGKVTFGGTTDGAAAGTLLTLKWRQC